MNLWSLIIQALVSCTVDWQMSDISTWPTAFHSASWKTFNKQTNKKTFEQKLKNNKIELVSTVEPPWLIMSLKQEVPV